MSPIAELAEFICSVNWDTIPTEVQKAAVLHVLDTVGAALGASKQSQIQKVTEKWLEEEHTLQACVWGTGKKARVNTAVFLNAMMSHTLELDDVHTNSKTHIGTVVIPAAWSFAESLNVNGKEFLTAVICGYEVMSRVGMAFGVSSHRNKGWHVTATAGTFGAAAACGKLLRLDEQEMIYALGLAGAQSFGTWAFLEDGASCKVLNPARAAQVGLESAFLAKAGMTGPEHILTAKDGGLLTMMSDLSDIYFLTAELGSVWQSIYMDNKPYPACRSTHCAIDAALKLKKKYNICADQVEQIEVDTYLVGYKQCGLSEGSIKPKNILNAKFSTPFVVAAALVYGEVTLKQFDQNVINRNEIQQLLKKVIVRPDESFTKEYPNHWGGKMKITLKDGRVYETHIQDASGSIDNPLSEDEVKVKAISLMKETCGDRAEQISKVILDMPEQRRIPKI